MGESANDTKWLEFREREGNRREVLAAPQGVGWIVRDGIVTRYVSAEDFNAMYEPR
jgi:hypothetical protein